MYFDDHAPPHFHAKYGSDECLISITDLCVIEGRIPSRALGMVIEWAASHHQELIDDWSLAKSLQPLKQIEPLK